MNSLLKNKKFNFRVKLLISIFYLVGIIGLNIPFLRNYLLSITPFTLLLVFVILIIFHKPWKIKHLIVFIFIFLTSFIIEMIGVKQGYIFGDYQYGKTLGVKLFDTPMIIGLNWLLLLYCTHVVVKKMRTGILIGSLFAALLMVVYDIFLEPAAIYLDMWRWEAGDVPLQNYVAWFIISFFLHIILNISKIKFENKIAHFIFFIQLVFFILIGTVLLFRNGFTF